MQAPDAAPPVQGNLLLNHVLGATVLINHPDEPLALDQAAADVAGRRGVPYAIPAGGSTGVGALGYVGAMLELAGQLWEQGVAPSALYFADGSGGTHAGIALGRRLYGLDFPAIGVRISGDAALGRQLALRVIEQAVDRLGVANPLTESDLRCDDRQVGEGYAIPTAGCLEAMALLARTEAILLDPVYTAKAFRPGVRHPRRRLRPARERHLSAYRRLAGVVRPSRHRARRARVLITAR